MILLVQLQFVCHYLLTGETVIPGSFPFQSGYKLQDPGCKIVWEASSVVV